MRRDRLEECLQRLDEVDGLLAHLRRAEGTLSNVRRTLADLCGEEAAGPLSPGAEQPAPPKAEAEKAGMPEPSPRAPLVDQVVLDTLEVMAREEEAREAAAQSPGATAQSPASSTHSASRRGSAAQLSRHRRRVVWGPCLCGLRMPLLFPDDSCLFYWDIAGLCFIIFETFALPFFITFQVEPSLWILLPVSLINVYFIADVFLNFCRGFKNALGFTVMEPRRIARRYLWWLPLDVLASIPWEWLPTQKIHNGNFAGLTKMLRLLRVTRLLRILRMELLPEKVQMFIEANSWLAFVQGVARVLFILFGVTHWAACMWFYVGKHSSMENTWIAAHMPKDADLQTEYIYSLYFTLTTMTTVGYGDITPQNGDEVCFVSVLLLVATVVFATLMGSLTDLIMSLQSDKHLQAERCRTLTNYMLWRNLPRDLIKAVRMHMVFLWETNKGYEVYEADIKEQLPPVLRKELNYHIYKSTLQSVPFMAWLWDYEACMKELASVVQPMLRSRGDRLFRVGQQNLSIFVLRSGSVRLSLNESLWSLQAEGEGEEVDEPAAGEDEHEDQWLAEAVTPSSVAGRVNSLYDVVLRARSAASLEPAGEPEDPYLADVLQGAVKKQSSRDMKEKWAARHIQKNWLAKVHSCRMAKAAQAQAQPQQQEEQAAARTRLLKRGICSRSVEAPAYFGESCLWVPYDDWAREVCPAHKYSARCETRCEVIVIQRSEVQEIIQSFSPWLKERFEGFREDVLSSMERLAAKECSGGPQTLAAKQRNGDSPTIRRTPAALASSASWSSGPSPLASAGHPDAPNLGSAAAQLGSR